ncbi:uncharacterized protein LOC124258335 [Haliotis rubra]|uniref:uncharacterized protein LOC124258335 n=1 Tax=Haliotis rubra TaxID=36100 RepID=UPI001EE5A936|nr:uncharacterized protein LOC124258335 [Haliotis rubra]
MMWLAVVLLCASFGTSAPATIHLTIYPQSAVDGAEVTLSCTTTNSGGLISVNWYRNNVEMFSTSSDADVSTSIFNPTTSSNESRAVAGRVTVSSSLQQHNVTLRINSTLDQGSVWKRQNGNRFSNNVTVEITDNTEAPATIHLTSYPQAAVDGAEVTLSCTTTQSGGLISVSWYRNDVEIFKTSSDADVSTSMQKPNTTLSEYRAVAGRVTVNSSLQQHNVTLRINSTLDQGSVWKCKNGKRFSNNVTVEITDNSEVESATESSSAIYSTTLTTGVRHTVESATDSNSAIYSTTLTTGVRHTVTKPKSAIYSTTLTTRVRHTGFSTTAPMESIKHEIIYAVAGSVGGVVVVVVIIIVVLLCTLCRRRENAKEEKHGKEGRFNEDSKRETILMEDNDLYRQYADKGVDGTEHQVSTEKQEVIVMEDNDEYHGFVKAESQKPAEKQQVPDVYSKVNKVKKTNNATEVQITLNIEDLYAKPIKPANRRSESSS